MISLYLPLRFRSGSTHHPPPPSLSFLSVFCTFILSASCLLHFPFLISHTFLSIKLVFFLAILLPLYFFHSFCGWCDVASTNMCNCLTSYPVSLSGSFKEVHVCVCVEMYDGTQALTCNLLSLQYRYVLYSSCGVGVCPSAPVQCILCQREI